ncbi:14967_t:CDS:1, partial [Cetraspora pellucida]
KKYNMSIYSFIPLKYASDSFPNLLEECIDIIRTDIKNAMKKNFEAEIFVNYKFKIVKSE